MKTWYCVTSSFDDRGRVTANITATKEAQAFVAQSKCA